MKILIVTQNYLPFLGGVETQARLFAHELAKDHRVEIAAANFAQARLPARLGYLHHSLLIPAYRDFTDGPIPVHALTPSTLDRVRMLPTAFRALPGARRIGDQALLRFGYRFFRSTFLGRLQALMQGVDVVHSLAGGYLGWAAQEAAASLRVPFVTTPYVHPHQWGDDPASVAFYQRCDAVVGLLESDREYLISLGVPREKVHVVGVVPLVADGGDGAAFRERHGMGTSPIVLYVGRMMWQKGAKAMLAAAPDVWRTSPDTRFVFIGPSSPESEDWFVNRDPRIHYLGKVSDQEKADALDACTVFCMPSISEILPAVYLEAWSYGKPVVGGRAHGLPGLIEGSGGGVTVSHDPAEVAGALIRLLADPELRAQYGEAGKDLVRHRYSLPAVVGDLLALYGAVTLRTSRKSVAVSPAVCHAPGVTGI